MRWNSPSDRRSISLRTLVTLRPSAREARASVRLLHVSQLAGLDGVHSHGGEGAKYRGEFCFATDYRQAERSGVDRRPNPDIRPGFAPTRSNQEDIPRSSETEHCSRTTEKP